MSLPVITADALVPFKSHPTLIKRNLHDKLNPPITTKHYNDVIMGAIATEITSLTIIYSTVYSDADQRKHQSSASLAFMPVSGEFPAPMASNAENVSIWWRHHAERVTDPPTPSEHCLFNVCTWYVSRHVIHYYPNRVNTVAADDLAPNRRQGIWAPSQYKDRLIYVWRFPC